MSAIFQLPSLVSTPARTKEPQSSVQTCLPFNIDLLKTERPFSSIFDTTAIHSACCVLTFWLAAGKYRRSKRYMTEWAWTSTGHWHGISQTRKLECNRCRIKQHNYCCNRQHKISLHQATFRGIVPCQLGPCISRCKTTGSSIRITRETILKQTAMICL